MKLLNVEALTIHFGGVVAVDNVSFDLEPGMTLGIIGPNGSGKTTLFNLLSGIYRPTSGTITLAGVNTAGKRTDEIFKLGMARTFQNGRLFWNLNVLENIMMGTPEVKNTSFYASLLRPSQEKAAQEKALQTALATMNIFGSLLTSQASKRARDLPYADRRRLEICRALASHPKILLLDEPSAGMDGAETTTLMHDLLKVKAAYPHLSILVVEHDMDFIKGLVDKVLALNYGKCMAYGSFNEVAQNPEVISAYLGKEATA